ncbi:hypothetical protein C7S13_6288 [Burkholderia cepacia]|nr:hypothetical protein [Burkholderia cepacia]QOH38432.1 hypothetical protein C7S14_0483 [Burkholderia cepacia]
MVRPGSRACILVRGHLFFRERSGCGPKEVAEARARAADGLLLLLFQRVILPGQNFYKRKNLMCACGGREAAAGKGGRG